MIFWVIFCNEYCLKELFSMKSVLFGLSALAEGPMDSRSCVRSSATRYLEIRASDFSETLPKVASWRD